jgi:hypothetical protein
MGDLRLIPQALMKLELRCFEGAIVDLKLSLFGG